MGNLRNVSNLMYFKNNEIHLKGRDFLHSSYSVNQTATNKCYVTAIEQLQVLTISSHHTECTESRPLYNSNSPLLGL